ncbi:SIMPL domain-containing protein [Micromonospora tulbaghiae]|uniref:SIMPL domain-containing protein n=1 Tax=Micromonospora tulbaghiae TaxID=479978 RepID=UPI00365ABC1D
MRTEIKAIDFDVTTKAELYAEAAGVRLGAVMHIDDVDPEGVGHERYRGHGSGGAASEQDLTPGHVVVSAAVVLGFSISQN